MNLNFLMTSSLFRGISENEIHDMLPCLLAVEKSYEKGEYLYRSGDYVNAVGLLLSGKISIENNDLWGNRTILNMITPGNVFAEVYACIPGEQLLVNIVSVTASRVLYLDMTHLMQPCSNNCPHHNKLLRNLLTISAQKNLSLSIRSFHTAAKTIRGRLLSYLSHEAAKNNSCEFGIPFNRQQLADYLNLDRSALSNELSKMARDGYFTCQRNHFILSTDKINEEIPGQHD